MNRKWLVPAILVIIILFSIYYIFTNISFVDPNMLENPATGLPATSVSPNEDIIGTINVYLIDPDEKVLVKEVRNISVKDLTSNTYLALLNNLQKSTSSLIAPIPINAEILSAEMIDNILVINFSKEFIEQDTSNELDKLILNSIVTTLSNLKEVNKIKFNIDGNENAMLGQYSLSHSFTKSSFQ